MKHSSHAKKNWDLFYLFICVLFYIRLAIEKDACRICFSCREICFVASFFLRMIVQEKYSNSILFQEICPFWLFDCCRWQADLDHSMRSWVLLWSIKCSGGVACKQQPREEKVANNNINFLLIHIFSRIVIIMINKHRWFNLICWRNKAVNIRFRFSIFISLQKVDIKDMLLIRW